MLKRQTSPSGRTEKRGPEAPKEGVEMPPKRPGRKPGKHSDQAYTQTSIYLPIELRNRVRARLYERGMEMSGLVEKMLRDWLSAKNNSSRPKKRQTENKPPGGEIPLVKKS